MKTKNISRLVISAGELIKDPVFFQGELCLPSALAKNEGGPRVISFPDLLYARDLGTRLVFVVSLFARKTVS